MCDETAKRPRPRPPVYGIVKGGAERGGARAVTTLHPTPDAMFRFSISNTREVDVNAGELETANVGRDDSFAERLRMTGDYRDDETVFRAENANPQTLDEAVAYVQGLFFRAPDRVWLGSGGDAQEVTAEIANRAIEPPL